MHDCAVVSDLHLFARRSRAERALPQIEEALTAATRSVLLGDIIDFRWSRFESIGATADAGEAWLQGLLRRDGPRELHYVLGNHDHVPEWIERLERLAAEHESFHWHPYHLRLGSAVFLHGDVVQPRMGRADASADLSADLIRYRERCGAFLAPARGHELAYDFALRLRLHILVARAWFPHGAVLRRIERYLAHVGGEVDAADVRDVYFGHTHRALSAVERGGRRFHNCGAPMAGLEFQVLRARLG